MRVFIVKILKLLSRFKVIGKIVRFTYQGEGVSLNKFYAQGHWRTRQQIKEKYKAIFDEIIDPYLDKIYFDNFYMLIFYNSRHDCDNVVGMEKIFMDCLKDKLVKGDSRVNYKGMMIFYDVTIPKNTFEFILIEGKYDEYDEIINKKHDKKSVNK
jgi:hypothetical protein